MPLSLLMPNEHPYITYTLPALVMKIDCFNDVNKTL